MGCLSHLRPRGSTPPDVKGAAFRRQAIFSGRDLRIAATKARPSGASEAGNGSKLCGEEGVTNPPRC